MSADPASPSAIRPTSDAYVEITDVGKDFVSRSRSVTALQDVNLSVHRGTFISLLGPSGCGKSTLLSMLAGLDIPSRGSVCFDGAALRGPNVQAGVVFQKDLLLDWRTALQNVMLQFEMRGKVPKDARDRAMDLLQSVGVGQFADSFPRQLSGGMRQRVAICRALVHDPQLLLMDEPFGALDAITREQLNLDLSRMVEASGKTVFFVTHSIEEAVFLGDRVIVMSNRPGRVIADVEVPVARPRLGWPRGESEFDAVVDRLRTELERGGAFDAPH